MVGTFRTHKKRNMIANIRSNELRESANICIAHRLGVKITSTLQFAKCTATKERAKYRL